MEKGLISVIIPVYKVKAYLEKCLDSVLGQNYRNLEIILVDDGSPDNCGDICDAYAQKDGRIKVIHRENGGLSAARNSGLDICTGEYIAFVDSDDWIEPSMYEKLYALLLKNQADIAQCGVAMNVASTINQHAAPRLVEHERLFEAILEKELSTAVWCNLYHHCLWEGLRFEEGYYYEDALIFPQIALRCRRLVRTGDKLYHYNRASSGIMRGVKSKRHLESKELVVQLYQSLWCNGPFPKQAVAFYLVQIIPARRMSIEAGEHIAPDEVRQHNKNMLHTLRSVYLDACKSTAYAQAPFKKKLYWFLYAVSPTIAKMLVRLAESRV